LVVGGRMLDVENDNCLTTAPNPYTQHPTPVARRLGG
jgi:hypothetical protein